MYSLKKVTWSSTEKSQLQIFSKLKFTKFDIYKQKKLLNIILIVPSFILYTTVPIFFGLETSYSLFIYTLLRFPVQVLAITLLIKFLLLEDLKSFDYNYNDTVTSSYIISILAKIFLIQVIGITSILVIFANLAIEGFILEFCMIVFILGMLLIFKRNISKKELLLMKKEMT